MSVITAVFGSGSQQECELRGRKLLREGWVVNGGAPVEAQVHRVFLGYRPYGWDTDRGARLHLDSRNGGGVVVDGVIDNRRELASTLGTSPGEPGFASDARLVFEAYRAWGRSCPTRLVGPFAFALWDTDEKALFCARDPFGIRSLFFRQDGSDLAIASQAHQLLDGTPGSFDEEYLADYLAWGFPVRRPSPFPRIDRLEAGHSLWFDGHRLTISRYWDPRGLSRFSHHDERRYHEEFRELFRQAVASALDRGTPVLCDLSGGLDSSSIACTLGELPTHGKETGRVHTMTYLFNSDKTAEEEEWRREIETRYGFEGHRSVLDHTLMTDPWEGAGHWDEPSIQIFSYHLFRWYADVGARVGATCALNGLGGEAVVTSDSPVPVHLADHLTSLRLPSFFRQLLWWRRGLHIPLLNLLAWAVVLPIFSDRYSLLDRKRYEIPKWISADFAARTDFKWRALGSWGDLKCRKREHQRRLERLYRIPGFLIRGHLEQATLVRYPFLHLPLVEFMMRVPYEYKADPVLTRKLLRQSMADLLPEGLRSRRRQPSGNPALYYALNRQWSSLEPALRDPILADLGILERSEFRKALELARIGHSTHTVPLLCTLALEFWARRVLAIGMDRALERPDQGLNLIQLPT